VTCASVGWLIHDGDECKVLCPNMGDLDTDDPPRVWLDPNSGIVRDQNRETCRGHFFLGLAALFLGLSGACVSTEPASF